MATKKIVFDYHRIVDICIGRIIRPREKPQIITHLLLAEIGIRVVHEQNVFDVVGGV